MASGHTRTRPHALAALFVLLGIFTAAGPTAQSASAAGPCNEWGNKESNEITVGHARKALLCLINRERQSRGRGNLHRSRTLQRAAQNHNSYMQNHRCFSHQCSGEASLTGRLNRVGWLGGGLSAWAYGENIAWGSGRLGTPRNIVQQWMNSSGHRANILSSRFDEIGIGYSKGTVTNKSANGAVMTTDFGWKTG